MTPFGKKPFSSLSGMQGTTPYDDEEITELRRRAWKEQGIVIISRDDKRLNPRDRKELVRIAEKVYRNGGEL
jgi:hypothetical protein